MVFNSDEERLSPTSRPVIEAEARRAHSVGILEPARPGGEYVMARKGAGTFHLEIQGKASHAGLQPELGASAIWDLAQKVAALHALTDLETGVTVNVGTVRGGERPNVVAAHAAAEIDLRAWSQADADATIAAMRTICERPHVAGTSARFHGQIHFPPWPPGLPGTERLLEIMRGAGASSASRCGPSRPAAARTAITPRPSRPLSTAWGRRAAGRTATRSSSRWPRCSSERR